MKEQRNLKSLIEQAKNGNADSFGEIYDLLVDRLYRFVYFRVGEKEDAQDLTEEIFLRVFKSINDYKEKKNIPFEAWFFRIARNKVIDYYRAKKKNFSLDDALEVEDRHNGPEETTITNLTVDEVINKLREIPSAYQEIIIFKFIEEKSSNEISAILDKPVDQIRVLQSRALKCLRKKIEIKKYERSIEDNSKKFKKGARRQTKPGVKEGNESQIVEIYRWKRL